MTINWAYIVLALAVFALWGLRRLGVDDTTADTITTFLMLGLGAAPSWAWRYLRWLKAKPPNENAPGT